MKFILLIPIFLFSLSFQELNKHTLKNSNQLDNY